ncbi:MAG TPA: site-specific DNA-methyltransferase [Terriglobales bacterium]|nr:site-specific DNA-methyltransferase [Terriglobales bacterium]
MVKKLTKTVDTFKHDADKRKNIPTAEFQSVLQRDQELPRQVKYPRNTDLDPQLVWRGKDEQDWSDLVVNAPPLYIQEKVHPKVLIDDLLRTSNASAAGVKGTNFDLFADFNGMPKDVDRTEFYQHDQNWSNRMILGDSLQVMASLAEREGLRGKVQCIYIDPPYGIKFNSNFQWSTTSRDVKDGNVDHITREPEQVKAFRDTWRDGIHSYLTYLRDRLTVARDLLTESGSVFVQIGDVNLHRIRALIDEVFGEANFIALIAYNTTSGQTSDYLANPKDYLLWFARSLDELKFRQLYSERLFDPEDPGPWQFVERDYKRQRLRAFLDSGGELTEAGVRIVRLGDATSQRQGRSAGETSAMGFPFTLEGRVFRPSGTRGWTTTLEGMNRASRASRLAASGNTMSVVRYFDEFPYFPINASWDDTGVAGFTSNKVYVVQTSTKVVERCILLATGPGDLVLDPTCGSGTTAYVAEQWGRRWITIDTSRVALALARARIMGSRYPYYLLADSREGQVKEAEITKTAPSSQPVHGNIRHGFVYERVPHITLKSIANNAEIDVIWEKWQVTLEPLRRKLNATMKRNWQEWEIPCAAEDPWGTDTQEFFYQLKAEQEHGDRANSERITECLHAINHNLTRKYTLKTLPERPSDPWPDAARKQHDDWWEARISRQREIDASIAAKAESEYLFDKPYEDKKVVRVAGPFTVESLLPHRVLGVDENDELIDSLADSKLGYGGTQDFVQMILENLKIAGVQQAHKEDKIGFTSLSPWPGKLICAEARYAEGNGKSGIEKRAAIFIGPEFGTVSRPDLVEAAREAGDSNFDVLITCAFNYDAHSSEFNKLGRIPVLKARMNADLHMAEDLKNTGKGNLFVIFGEPDIAILPVGTDGKPGQIRVQIKGVDVFHPNTGEVLSDGAEGIACWFIDTDYNEESFFVRHAYFLGANDPYKALKTTLKAEINQEAWETLHSDTSRPFDKPKSGRIAVKVINHLGDEVMKVFRV